MAVPIRSCRARNRSGTRCRRVPRAGSPVCASHGAGAPQVRQAADYRVMQQQAALIMRRIYARDPQRFERRPIAFDRWPEDFTTWGLTAWSTTQEHRAMEHRVSDICRTEPDPAFGPLLRQIRRRQGLSLKTMAAACGISYGYLGLLERSERSPSTVMVEILLDELRATPVESARLRAAGVPGVGRDWSANFGTTERDARATS